MCTYRKGHDDIFHVSRKLYCLQNSDFTSDGWYQEHLFFFMLSLSASELTHRGILCFEITFTIYKYPLYRHVTSHCVLYWSLNPTSAPDNEARQGTRAGLDGQITPIDAHTGIFWLENKYRYAKWSELVCKKSWQTGLTKTWQPWSAAIFHPPTKRWRHRVEELTIGLE